MRPCMLFVIGLVGVGAPVAAQEAPPASAPPLAPTFDVQDNRLALPAPVVFETGGPTLAGDAQPGLEHVAAFLNAKAYVTLLRLEGHVDADTPPEKAQGLTEARALAAARWLVSRGISCKRLLPVGFGASKPVAPNDTPENKAQNRRLEARVAELRGRAIGGMPVDGGGRVAGDPCQP